MAVSGVAAATMVRIMVLGGKQSHMKYSLQPFLVLVWFLTSMTAYSQNNWKGKKCAIVLTYDDALNVHLDNVVPALDSLGLKGTFYLTAAAPGSKDRIEDWKKAAKKGHELGNHTLFHPCVGNQPGREWVRPEYDLSNYTLKRMLDEIRMTNVFLQSLDGKTRRTFAYPCGDMTAGDTSYVEAIKTDFVAARGVVGKIMQPNSINRFDVNSYGISGNTAEEMIAIVKQAMDSKGLAVFIFHGVGGEHGINVSRREHNKLLGFLKQHEKEIWVTTLLDVIEQSDKIK
jgi:peptidoglycan-N-acetylglucosamine deacetylase